RARESRSQRGARATPGPLRVPARSWLADRPLAERKARSGADKSAATGAPRGARRDPPDRGHCLRIALLGTPPFVALKGESDIPAHRALRCAAVEARLASRLRKDRNA